MTLESESGLNLLCKDIGNRLVEVTQYLHCKLWLDASLVDQLVDCVYQAFTNPAITTVSGLQDHNALLTR